MARFIVFCAALAFSSHIYAQVPIEVLYSGSDSVGQRIVFQIKESIRGSKGLTLNTDDTKFRMQLSIVTFDNSANNDSKVMAFSAAWLWINPKNAYPWFLTHSVGTCGTQRTRECAEELVAISSSQGDEVLKLLRQSIRK